jgi:hypothetical protein
MNNKIEFVISRYNEDLNWINENFFSNNDIPIIVYNKGINDNINIKKEYKIINLENVGRESHTYLYHIINNYDNLADNTIFLPGSSDMTIKNHRARIILKETMKHNKTIILGQRYYDIKNAFYDYLLDDYTSSHQNNLINSSKLEKSEIRPFGKWYEHYFGDKKTQYITWSGILSISKENILFHPKEYYENLIKQLESSSNPEVGHYFERAWAIIFHPLKDAVFIDKYHKNDLYT